MPRPFSDPQPKKVIDKLAQVQWRATMMGQGLEHLPCGQKLRAWRKDRFRRPNSCGCALSILGGSQNAAGLKTQL